MAEVIKNGAGLDKKLADLAKNLANGAAVKVGFLEGNLYPDGGPPIAMVAAIQNFGSAARGIPARPFFTNMVKAGRTTWGDYLAHYLEKHDFDVKAALEEMGIQMVGELQQAITDTNSPPLSAITLMLRWMKVQDPDLKVTGSVVGEAAARVARGDKPGQVSLKPLIASGEMQRNVKYEVTSL